MAETETRYPCCEHCIDIKEGCPRPQGHGGACPIEGCSTHEDLFGEDPIPEEESEGVVNDIAHWEMSLVIEKMKDDLIDQVTSMVGYEPPGLRVLLRVLSHPDMAGEAKKYFEAMDIGSRCTKYEPPWNCAREAEAQYQNIQYGWLGANGVGYDESWCEPCRRKVMGT